MIVLLSGDRGVGKSTACQKLVKMACRRRKTIGGFLSTALFDDKGDKVGIKLVDPRTGEERYLASIAEDLGGPLVGIYHMNAEALSWGATLALSAIEGEFDLILIDELGPLELNRNEGFAGVLPALYEVSNVNCLVVVRPELIDDLERRLKATVIVRRVVTLGNRNGMPGELARLLWGPA